MRLTLYLRAFTSLSCSLALLAHTGCGSRSDIQTAPYAALGEVVATKTAKLCGGKGSVILVVNEADKQSATAVGLAVKEFRKILSKSGTLEIKAIESLKPTTAIISGVEPFSASKFLEVVNHYASADVLVSFAGVPRLTAGQVAQIPPKRPRIVVAVSYNPPARAMFNQGVIHLAILPQPRESTPTPTPRTTAEWFDTHYRLITPETAHSLLLY